MTEKFNIEDSDKIIKAEVERFLLLCEKTFKEYQQKNLEEENLDSEDGILTDFLTKVFSLKNQRAHSIRFSR